MIDTDAVPQLTPSTLVGLKFPRDYFGDIKIAIIGYCPPPASLNDYAPESLSEQPFILLAQDRVRILTHEGRRFLSLDHVYGGPVSAAIVEELAYYGIDTILAYGLSGGLATKSLSVGDTYVVGASYVADGTTPHYTSQTLLAPDPTLMRLITSTWDGGLEIVQAATVDAIYREHEAFLNHLRANNCDIIHIDTSHLYAASQWNAEGRRIRAIQCGVISDVMAPGGLEMESLADMLSGAGSGPLERVSDIVRFYIEKISPQL